MRQGSHLVPVVLLASKGERICPACRRRKKKQIILRNFSTRALPLALALRVDDSPPPPHVANALQDVIDGDLCEQFSSLPFEKQKLVANGLDRTVGEVVKKLEDTRNRLL